LCGSGFEAVVVGAQQILTNDADIVLVGGTENMSQAPFVVRNVRFGTKFGSQYQFEDTLWGSLTDSYVNTPMAITAENLAQKYQITRQNADEFALLSQTRWASAFAEGKFKDEIVPVPIKTKKGVEDFVRDEHPRQTTPESLQKLPPVFKKDGVVTAGNASGISDGAAALVLMSEEALRRNKDVTPLAQLISSASFGVDPNIMGIGPVYAIRKALEKANLKLEQMELVEVNEAFAAQFLAVEKELGLDRNKTNVDGGAVALGHPLAASGGRITAHLIYELRRRKAKFAVGSACIGGGQGIALILQSCL